MRHPVRPFGSECATSASGLFRCSPSGSASSTQRWTLREFCSSIRICTCLPESAYFLPVLYAALNFGIEGALPTSLWCVALTIPNVLLFHDGDESIGIAIQLTLLVILGVVVARRVDKERRARLVAEDANRQLADIQVSLKSYIGMALRAQEDERFRLSRELHDETVQELVVAKGALENVPEVPGQRDRLDVVDLALQRCIDGVRRFCRALRP